MTLADVLTELSTRGALKPSRVPAMKTSLKNFALALGHASPEQCPVDAACLQEATWAGALEAHWRTLEAQGRTISASMRRNVRNDIRKVFTLAAAHGLIQAPRSQRLIQAPQRKVFERQQRATAPYQATYRPQTGPRRVGLPQAEWPPEIVQGWQDYKNRCGLRLREITLRDYGQRLGLYLGYQAHVCGRTPAWEDLFDVTQLRAFVLWHGARVGRTISSQGRQVVIAIAAMAKVLGHRHARALADLRNTLTAPAPLHNKRQHHWVSLSTLEAVADACLAEGRVPVVVRAAVHYPGLRRAIRLQRGVMLKLLVRVPLRQRNVRELQLERNLWKDPITGHWQLHFSGDELKIGTRGGRVNEYNLDLTADTRGLVPVLEEFLTGHRPHLPGAATSPFLFLTQVGKPYSMHALRHELSVTVARHTGQRWFPHMVRTTWATEYLQATGDFTTAATMLGDTLAVVMKTYYDIVHKDQHAKAKAFLTTALHAG